MIDKFNVKKPPSKDYRRIDPFSILLNKSIIKIQIESVLSSLKLILYLSLSFPKNFSGLKLYSKAKTSDWILFIMVTDDLNKVSSITAILPGQFAVAANEDSS